MGRIFNEEERKIYKDLMEYPETFIDKCLSVFPEDEEMVELLEEKSFLVISKIQREINKEITSSDIVDANEHYNMDEIIQRAYMIEKNKDLKNDFNKLYEQQYTSKGKYIKNGIVLNKITRFKFCEYRPPVSAEVISDSKMAGLEKSIQKHLDYNESRRTAGRIAAENHIAGGGILPEYDGPGGALEKKYKM